MKVGIINHWMVNNYGALLLAYGLEKKLLAMGYDVESISYLPDEVKYPWKSSMIKKVGFLTYVMRLGYFGVFILPRQLAFRHMRAQMNTSPKSYSDDTISQIDSEYDKIVIGGDQLWNCKINYYNVNNFLPFISDPKRKLVYAASLSQDTLRSELEEEFRRLVTGFGYITTRETRASEIIEECTGIRASRISDPAFLLTQQEWLELADCAPDTKDPYVFVYQVQSDTEVITFAEKKAKELGCRIIYCPFPLKKQIKCLRKPYISPEQWLGYMSKATCVVTDAFHGVVFSILFNRPFYAQISSYGKDTGSRITNILNVYSLQDRLMENGVCDPVPIDFSRINQLIQAECKDAEQHLHNMMAL